jgi:hypothetical protein
MYKDTLGDRIGERMRSRLQEMCVVVEMHGADLRQTFKKATFGNTKIKTVTTTTLEPVVEGEGVDVASSLKGWAESEALKGASGISVGGRAPLSIHDEDEPKGPARMGKHAKLLDVSPKD